MHHQVPVVLTASLPDWLTAIGGLLVFAATVALAVVAVYQMKEAERASAGERDLVNRQIAASIAQGAEIRAAARAQLQPVVFAHGDRTLIGDKEPSEFLTETDVGFTYRLKNEGTGLALNIRHGIDLNGKEYEYIGGMQWRVLNPSEEAPPRSYVTVTGAPVPVEPFMVPVHRDELSEAWAARPRCDWARYENMFGERYETRNPSDPTQSADFRRLEEPQPASPLSAQTLPEPPGPAPRAAAAKRGVIFGRHVPLSRPDEPYLRTLGNWWRSRH